MGRITMEQIAVMSVQYAQFSFEYFLQSMETCGIKNIELWAGAPHFCDDIFPSWRDAQKRESQGTVR